MRIQNTDDYREYLNLLSACTCGCCTVRHCGKAAGGCGITPGTPVKEKTLT